MPVLDWESDGGIYTEEKVSNDYQGKRLLGSDNTENLHPVRYAWAWKMYCDSLHNRWHWGEVPFDADIAHLKAKDRTDEELQVINLTLSFLANQDNLVLSLIHI